MSENRTLDYYNKNASSFAEATVDVDFYDTQKHFQKLLPEQGYILDFGCGSGRDIKYFLSQHFQVDAIDGSEELCRIASDYTGIKVKKMLFKELEEKKDAIQRKKDKEISKKIAGLWEQRMQIPQYHYENNDLFVMMPHGTSDLKKEGRSLNHCVADYKEFVAEEKTQIFFIRKKAAPQKSFYTLEIKNHEIEQCHGRNNVDMTEEIRSFAYGYLKQLNTLNEKAAVKAVA